MRPKKRILLVDNDLDALSLRSFQLTTRSYAVWRCTAAAEEAVLYRMGTFDLAIVECNSQFDGHAALRELKAFNRETPVLMTSREYSRGLAHHADGFLDRGAPPADLLERVRVMVTRKRGPKPAVPERSQELAG